MAVLPLHHYHVGIVCALSIELAALRGMLDEEHGKVDEKDIRDHNIYFAGKIHTHNVVVACLPEGIYGVVSAATVAKDMSRTFHSLRFGLLVGIGGGIPDLAKGVDIRLGDVVVCKPDKTYGGVVQYDRGKSHVDGVWERKGSLNAPPGTLLAAIAALKAEHDLEGSQMRSYLDRMFTCRPNLKMSGYDHPGVEKDVFYALKPGLDVDEIVNREARPQKDPHIHYGTILSGNQVIEDAVKRDMLRDEFQALCVEMEAAGILNNFPCLVIRGISDYADRHKNKVWQRYAAATAASYAKELLSQISTGATSREKTIQEVLDSLDTLTVRIEQQVARQDKNVQDAARNKFLDWISASTHDKQYRDRLQKRHPGTGQWFLNSDTFRNWESGDFSTLLSPGVPGAGKSVMSAIVIQRLQLSGQGKVTFAFCDYNRQDEQNTETLVRMLLRQVLEKDIDLPDISKEYKQENTLFLEEAISLLVTAIAKLHRVFFVIDAIDECTESTRKSLITVLRKLLTAVNTEAHCKLSILVTYRPGFDMSDLADTSTELCIRADLDDQQTYLDCRFEELSACAKDNADFRTRVSKEIAGATDGMFLLATLYFESLKSKRTISDLETSLREITKNAKNATAQTTLRYAHAYDASVQRIEQLGEDDRVWARRVISWVVHAREPLRTNVLSEALAIRPDAPTLQDEIREEDKPVLVELLCLCAGLLIINPNTKTVELVHYTAKEYFIHPGHCPPWVTDAARDVALTCLTYLGFKWFSTVTPQTQANFDTLDPSKHLPEYSFNKFLGYENYHNNHAFSLLETFNYLCRTSPLISYVARYWGFHASTVQSCLMGMLVSMFEDERFVNTAVYILLCASDSKLWISDTRFVIARCDGNAMRLAAFFNLDLVAKHFTSGPRALSSLGAGWDDTSPLRVASLEGHTRTLEILLPIWHANVPEAVQKYFHTLLQFAVKSGRGGTVQYLLDYAGCITNLHDIYGNSLLHAIQSNQTEIAKILLQHGALLEGKTNGARPLFGASLSKALGNLAPVRLKSKAEACAVPTARCESPVPLITEPNSVRNDKVASTYGTEVILDSRPAANRISRVENCNHSVIGRCRVNHAADDEKRTELYLAAIESSTEITHIILEHLVRKDCDHGCIIEIRLRDALIKAACNDKMDAVKLLLDTCPPIGVSGGRQSNVLLTAIPDNTSDPLWLWLRVHVKPTFDSESYRTALQAALALGRSTVAALFMICTLYDAGPSEKKAKYGELLLAAVLEETKIRSFGDPHIGVSQEIEDTTRRLLEHGADTCIRDQQNRTALQIAVACCLVSVVRLLSSYKSGCTASEQKKLWVKALPLIFPDCLSVQDNSFNLSMTLVRSREQLKALLKDYCPTITDSELQPMVWSCFIESFFIDGRSVEYISKTRARFKGVGGRWYYFPFDSQAAASSQNIDPALRRILG